MKKLILLGTICFLLLLIIIGNVKSATTYQPKVSYSGKDLFRGIFFKEGDIPEIVPELTLYSNPKKDDQRVKNLDNKLVSLLEKSNPSFFTSFKKNIQSGDPKTVEACLTNSETAIKHELININNLNDKNVQITPFTGVLLTPINGIIVYTPPPPNLVILASASVDPIKENSLKTETLAFSIAENLKN